MLKFSKISAAIAMAIGILCTTASMAGIIYFIIIGVLDTQRYYASDMNDKMGFLICLLIIGIAIMFIVGLVFVAIDDYVQTEKSKHRYNIIRVDIPQKWVSSCPITTTTTTSPEESEKPE